MTNLIIPASSSGSGTGISYYSTAMLCPRKARLEKERVSGRVTGPATFKMDTGTCFHKVMELYHGGQGADIENLQVEDPAMQPALEEARRLFHSYCRVYGPEYFGKVIGTEVHMPGECALGCESKSGGACNCASGRNATSILDLLGTPLTGRIDRVSMLDMTDPGFKHAAEKGGAPGVYLADYKVKFSTPGNWESQCLYSMQAKAYMIMWNALNSHKCRGFLFQLIVVHKKMLPSYYTVTYVPPPTEEDESILATFLASASSLAETNAPLAANCFMYNSTCPFLANGACNRR